MSDLSPEAKAFLKAHRHDGTPTPADAERVRAALQKALGPAVLPSPKSPWLAGVGGKLVVAGVVALAGAALMTLGKGTPPPPLAEEPRVVAPVEPPAASRELTRALEPVTAPEAIAAPEPARAPSDAPLAKPFRPRPVVRQAERAAQLGPQASPAPEPSEAEPSAEDPPPGPTGPPIEDPVAVAPKVVAQAEDELMLMGLVQEHLRLGNPRGALSVLAEWEKHFGRSGQLREEGRAARIVALCELGDVAAGREEATQYFTQFPGSTLRNRVERACGRSAP